jgi:hypothetical protein
MTHLNLNSCPVAVREFVMAIPRNGEETILELDGKPYASIRSHVDDPSGQWSDAKNARRCELIERDVDGTISTEETGELESLQLEFRRYRHRVAPLPLAETRRMLEELEIKVGAADL